jgi:hypothetical protein
MLNNHPHDETSVEQRIPIVERQFGEQREHGFSYLSQILAGSLRRQDRQPSPLVTAMREGVVEIVVLRRNRASSTDSAQEPELLEVADVSQIPDERGLQWRDLTRQLSVRERLQQILRPPPRVLEGYDELRR